MGRHAVHFVVGRHHADGAAFLQGFLEREQKSLAQHAHGDIGRGAIHAGFRLAVTDAVFQGGDQAGFVAEGGVSLKAAHRGNAQARNQKRIFAVGFLHASPTRIAGNIDDRRQGLVGAARTSFEGGHRKQRFDQFGIESSTQRNRLRKAGAVNRGVTVQAFFVEDHRNAEPRILDEELLDGVGGFGHLARVQSLACIARTADLANSVPVFESRFAFARSKRPSASTSFCGFSRHTQSICAIFSRNVMRDMRSRTRFSADNFGLR